MICKGTLLSNRAVVKHWIPYFTIAAITTLISSVLFAIDVVDKVNQITEIELDRLLIVQCCWVFVGVLTLLISFALSQRMIREVGLKNPNL